MVFVQREGGGMKLLALQAVARVASKVASGRSFLDMGYPGNYPWKELNTSTWLFIEADSTIEQKIVFSRQEVEG